MLEWLRLGSHPLHADSLQQFTNPRLDVPPSHGVCLPTCRITVKFQDTRRLPRLQIRHAHHGAQRLRRRGGLRSGRLLGGLLVSPNLRLVALAFAARAATTAVPVPLPAACASRARTMTSSPRLARVSTAACAAASASCRRWRSGALAGIAAAARTKEAGTFGGVAGDRSTSNQDLAGHRFMHRRRRIWRGQRRNHGGGAYQRPDDFATEMATLLEGCPKYQP